VSSARNEVCRLESSTPVKVNVTEVPTYADRSNVLRAYAVSEVPATAVTYC
jgi:hypothetical protein